MRVLIVRVGAMGDVLHTLPAVAALRAARPDCTLDWAVDERWLQLLEGDDRPVISSAIRVPIRAWKAAPMSAATLRSLLSFRRLRGHYDLVVDLQGTLRSAAIARLAAGPRTRVAGFSTPREPQAAWLYKQRHARQGTHVVDMNTALLSAAAGVPLQPCAFALPHDAAADRWAQQLTRSDRVCLLVVRAGWDAKQWPAAHFGKLAQSLREAGWRVLVSASAAGDKRVAEVLANSDGAAEEVHCHMAALIAVTRRCALVIGGDTGPVHLAAALGIPVVALFGPTNPARNGPWGNGCKAMTQPAGPFSYKRANLARPLDRVPVDEVLSLAQQVTGEDAAT